MASQVEVRGGGDFDGAILQNAASEATLLRLVTAMESRSPGTGAAARELASQQRNTKAINQSTSAVRASTEETGRFSKAMKEAAGSVSSLVSMGLQSAFDFLGRGLNVFRETSSVGAAFNNSIFELAASAAESNMSMEEFSALIQKNSTLFSTFGGTVTQGAKAFGILSETMRKDIGDQFYGMGLTVRDLNDYLAAYLDTERAGGRLRNRSNKDLIEGARNYIMELDKMSKLTGLSRKAMEAQMRASAIDPIIQALRTGPGANLAVGDANLAAMKEFGGADLEQAVKEIAAGTPTSEMAKMLMSRGQLSQSQAQSLIKGQTDVFETLTPALQRFESFLSEQNAAGLQLRNPFAAAMGQLALAGRRLGERTPEQRAAAAKEQQDREYVTTQLARASDAFNRIKNNLIAAFLRSETFNNFLKGFERVSEWISNNAPRIIEGLASLFKPVTDWFKTTFGEFTNLMEKGEYKSAFKLIFDGVKNMIVSTFETISDFLVYLWTGEMPERLLNRINSAANSFAQGFMDPRARREGDVAQSMNFSKEDFGFSGIKKALGLDNFSFGKLLGFDLSSGGFFDTLSKFFENLKLPNISNFFDKLSEEFTRLKNSLAEKDVGGKSILEWFTEFKDLFMSIPSILESAEKKLQSMSNMFSMFTGGGGSGGMISNIKDIVDGLNKLTSWFDNIGPDQINKAERLIALITPLKNSLNGSGGNIDFEKISQTLDSLTTFLDKLDLDKLNQLTTSISTLVDKFNQIDADKIDKIMGSLSPLFRMFVGKKIVDSIFGSDESTFDFDKINKTLDSFIKIIETVDVEKFKDLTTTITSLVDRIDRIDVEKFKDLVGTVTPLFDLFAGKSKTSSIFGSNEQAVDFSKFTNAIDPLIRLIDKIEAIDTNKFKDLIGSVTTLMDKISTVNVENFKALSESIAPLFGMLTGNNQGVMSSIFGDDDQKIDFDNINKTIDSITRLIDRLDRVDVDKFKNLIAAFTPIFTMFSNGSITSLATDIGDDKTTFVEKIDKTIALIDKLEKFNVGPVKELNAEFKSTYETAKNFIGLKDEAIGFVDGLSNSVDRLTTEIQELKAVIPQSVKNIGNAIGSVFGSDERANSTATPTTAPAAPDTGWMQWLGNKFDEMIGENKEQTRQLKNINRDRLE